MLFELAHRDDLAVSDLRRDLDLDAGYLSRILSGFTADPGWWPGRSRRPTGVARSSGSRPRAGGVRRAGPAAGGRDRHACWRRSTTVSATELVACDGPDPPDAGQRDALDAASCSARPEPGDLGWVVERHGARYAAEYGWDATFEALVARIVADFAERWDTQTRGGAGSPSWTANGSAACSAPPPTPTTPHSCVCCSSSRRRAAPVSGPGWWTSACDSPGVPAIGESRCGPTMYWLPPAGSMSGPVSAATVASRTTASGTISSASTGHDELYGQARQAAATQAPAGCRASWPAAGHPSSPSCGCRWAGS